MAKVAVIYSVPTDARTGWRRRLKRARSQRARTSACARFASLHRKKVVSQQGWVDHRVATQHVAEATLEDIEWDDGYAFGSPTRFGLPSAPLKQFIRHDQSAVASGQARRQGGDRVHRRGESARGPREHVARDPQHVLSLGSVVVAPGYTNRILFVAGGNPYGTSYTATEDRPGRGAAGSGISGSTIGAVQCAPGRGSRHARRRGLLIVCPRP
jgi:NAD(P)H dehydrogenase (quinone)